MPPTLTLLHTSPIHIPNFDALIKDQAPDIPVAHIVGADFLDEAREKGISPELTQRIHDKILAAIADDAKVVLCTCSSIGGCAESADGLTKAPVIRVDRPMAAKAVSIGSPIIVAAALASTLGPTTDLIRDAAAKAAREVELVEVLCAKAWERFEAGDQQGYLQEIATELRQVAHQGQVIVLAQASMAGAAELCSDLPIPVLSSPALGVEAAIAAYQRG
jgi:hypothetical protein